jgi:hypothetical protein
MPLIPVEVITPKFLERGFFLWARALEVESRRRNVSNVTQSRYTAL